ncbi:hypothetical protein HRbin26_01185 [bacterium HR26]|nr:hypothetical protein HRbin26_01185 [bacterium HR26]
MSEVERIEIRSGVWKAALVFTVLVAFALIGLALAVFSENLIGKIVGLICFVFFGVVGGVALYGRVRGDYQRVAVSRAGLEVYLPGVGWRLIPWGDIEEIDVLDIAGQQFTGVRLRSYEALLAGLTPEESRAAARRFAALRLFGRAAAVLLGSPRLWRLLRGSEPIEDLPSMLAFNRETFGAELLLGWDQRDRNARDFAEFLRKWQRAGDADSRPR